MIITSYCHEPPIKEAIDDAFAAMSDDEKLEIEWAMEQWRDTGVEDSHIYQSVGTRYEILVRRVPHTQRKIVAVYDKNRSWIEAVNLEDGEVKALVRPAHLWLGPHGGPVSRNRRWTG